MMEKVKDSIFKFLRLDNLVENLSGYVETRIELIKIEVREEVVKIISNALMVSVLFLLGLLFLIFFSIAGAIYLNHYLNHSSGGFWIVSGIYGMMGLIIVLFRKNIGSYFERYLIEQAKRPKK
ncbi:MAG TPA: phage holin family protein [Cyclobacteriaceae bacterium]|nr:phage holin family protein [Cyclobacteriaceae bacterium]